jgi:hypothetical protein
VTWKRTVNDALGRATGLELRRRRPPAARRQRLARPGDRLVERPVFIMCTLRSGSTLFRVLLNSHSQLHSPHELHLRYVSVGLDKKWSERSMKELGLDETRLRYLLWDRILHRELADSGKPTIIDKTPNNVFIADHIRACWPDARFLFLLRHPASIARSRQALRPEDADNQANVDLIARYCNTLEHVRRAHDGHTVRYEELTAEPERVLRGVCSFLEVPFEPAMLEYGQQDHGRFKSGLGDYADKIRTGRIQPPEPPPAEVPEPLREAAAAWGYLPAGAPTT